VKTAKEMPGFHPARLGRALAFFPMFSQVPKHPKHIQWGVYPIALIGKEGYLFNEGTQQFCCTILAKDKIFSFFF
jgi:hypothetical protein